MHPRSVLHHIKRITGHAVVGRQVEVRPDDTFLVSYPKSGNTWVRFLLTSILHQKDPGFGEMEDLVPDIYVRSHNALASIRSPRIMKSHEYFDPRYQNVIYIVRDPRDVLISYWYHQQKFGLIDRGLDLELFGEAFLTGVDAFGSWAEHVGSWLGAREGAERFLLVRYEDLLTSTKSEFSRILDFLKLGIGEMEIDRAVAGSTFQKLQALEKAQGYSWTPLRNTRGDLMFMRSGKQGSWHELLSRELAARIEREWGSLMRKLHYLNRS